MKRAVRKGPRNLMRSTLLVVGEGADDRAFITHMKQLYCPRDSGMSVKVEAGDGGSPGNVITHAIRKYQGKDYDRRLFVLDADLPPDEADYKRATKEGYEIILWQPQCLEGALLDSLGEPVGNTKAVKSSRLACILAWMAGTLTPQPTQRSSPGRYWTPDEMPPSLRYAKH